MLLTTSRPTEINHFFTSKVLSCPLSKAKTLYCSKFMFSDTLDLVYIIQTAFMQRQSLPFALL